MSSLNKRNTPYRNLYGSVPALVQNHYGTVVPNASDKQKLVRLTMANMLWEGQFYMDGQSTAKLIADLVKKLDAPFVSKVAKAAREVFKLRHVPLLLTRELARDGRLSAQDLAAVIQRPDEISEFVSIYWKDKKQPLSNQVKKGLALALGKFNAFQLAKWDKNSSAVRLRDVLFLTHAKPANEDQAKLFKQLADQTLETPDTWETELSAGADKRETFTRLMTEKKLGALAFLRNLRNMRESGVDDSAIRKYAQTVNVDRVLPFRYIAAARIMPQYEDMLEAMMFRSLATQEKLKGKTKLYVDVSSSMYQPKVSQKSDLTRQDASLALAMLCRELCEDVEIYSFSGQALRIAPRRGFALAEAIKNSQGCSGTDLGRSLMQTQSVADRVIVITDEQSTHIQAAPYGGAKGYIINVGSYENGVSHGEWINITGFSEAVMSYIQAVENEKDFM